MRTLKKVFYLLIILAALSALKYVLDKYSPISIVFHYNLLTGIQYFLLIGTILWISTRLRLKYVCIIYLVLLSCSEAFFYLIFRNSEKTSGQFHELITDYYLTYELNFPETMYDSVLSYTLKKNSVYNHSNIEFTNKVSVNSAGLRDDSASLIKPAIICLGDSYTQGWGVQQDKSFPELIQRATGLKVLNAGITSYGTARELLLLNRLDTSNLKYLIIQYCYNDWQENKTFLEHNNYLPVGSPETIRRAFKGHQLARTYFPFKYTFTLLRMALKRKHSPSNTLDYVAPSADAFLKILSGSKIDFSKIKVFIIDTNRYPDYDHHFLDTLETRMQKENFNNAHIIKFPELNNQRFFYPLDNHLNDEGHKLIADKISHALKK